MYHAKTLLVLLERESALNIGTNYVNRTGTRLLSDVYALRRRTRKRGHRALYSNWKSESFAENYIHPLFVTCGSKLLWLSESDNFKVLKVWSEQHVYGGDSHQGSSYPSVDWWTDLDKILPHQ